MRKIEKKLFIIAIMAMYFALSLSLVSADSPLLTQLKVYISFDNITTNGSNQTFINIHNTSQHNASNTYLGSSIPYPINQITGKINNSIAFNGINNSVLIPASLDSDETNSGGVSFAFWVNVFNLINNPNIRLITKASGGPATNGFILERISGNDTVATFRLYFRDGGGGSYIIDFPLTPNTWYHLTGVWNGSRGLIYRNGVLFNTTDTGTYVPASTVSIQLGNLEGDRFLNGTIDEFGYWNRSLSAGEIFYLYNFGSGKSYPFNPFNPFNEGFVENNQTFNSSTHETAKESFTINLTYDNSYYSSISANLIYNGISYSGTKTGTSSNILFIKTMDMPSYFIGNNSFYWQIALTNSSGTFYFNSTFQNQTVNPIYFAICNSTLNISYINFTFKDEESGNMNAVIDSSTWTYYLGSGEVNKTLLFSNSTTNPSYAFCFSPQHKTLNEIVTIQYSANNYPQRRYYLTGTLTNSTTNKILYLLNTSYGIYSSYAVQDGYSHAISGVTVQVERQFSGVWTLIEQGTTDSSGLATFWLNPNYDHRIIFSKSGYTSTTVTIRPTQSLYTAVLSAGVTTTAYALKNIEWVTSPPIGRLNPNTAYTFGFNITASDGNIIGCKMEIRNLTFGLETNVSGCNSYGGNISLSFNTGNYSKLFGYYYIDFGSGYQLIKANDAWFIESVNITSSVGGLFEWLKSFKELPEWGSTHNRREFSTIVGFFFLITILTGIFTFFTGYDFNQPGGAMLLVWGMITLGSFAGLFYIEGISQFTFFNKYTIFTISSFMTWGFLLNWWRRSST